MKKRISARKKFVDRVMSLGFNKKQVDKMMDDGVFSVEKPDGIYLFGCDGDYWMKIFPVFDELKKHGGFIQVAKDTFDYLGVGGRIDAWAKGELKECPLVGVDMAEISLHADFSTADVMFTDETVESPEPAPQPEVESEEETPVIGYRVAKCVYGGPSCWIDSRIYKNALAAVKWVLEHNEEELDVIVTHSGLYDTETRSDFAFYICPFRKEDDTENNGEYEFVG